jgi:crotonobetainyl-CoA:carnitine CoA-transferase CaiB-like acyl-CoA transferase
VDRLRRRPQHAHRPGEHAQTLADDPQFQHRLPFHPREALGAEQLPTPIKLMDEDLPAPTKAPTPGQHTDELLAEVLGYPQDRIAELRDAGAFG